MFGHSNLTYCDDEDSAASTFWELYSNLIDLSNSPDDFGCPVPCTKLTYTTTINYYHQNNWFYDYFVPTEIENNFALYVFFSTLNVQQQIESFDYDFASFLAAAGGKLGLFLGFSCLSVLFAVVNCVSKMFA